MKAKLTLFLLAILTLGSCKKEEKPVETEAKKEEVPAIFKVTVDANVKKDDAFHLYYSEDGTDNFSEESSVWVEFKESTDGSQSVVFNLPEAATPTNLRLDFGVNKEQEDILLKGIKMEYMGKTFQVSPANMLQYFRINELNTVYDAQTGIISPVKTQKAYTGPSFYALPALQDEINKLVK
ncbi:MAG TPA: hypothetical protein VGB50_13405 [Flavobacterium sp.]|jgi:hypothetical protein